MVVGKMWFQGFKERHGLSCRKPEATSMSGSAAFNRVTVSELFRKLSEYLLQLHYLIYYFRWCVINVSTVTWLYCIHMAFHHGRSLMTVSKWQSVSNTHPNKLFGWVLDTDCHQRLPMHFMLFYCFVSCVQVMLRAFEHLSHISFVANKCSFNMKICLSIQLSSCWGIFR